MRDKAKPIGGEPIAQASSLIQDRDEALIP
jgi:hypothetical protein